MAGSRLVCPPFDARNIAPGPWEWSGRVAISLYAFQIGSIIGAQPEPHNDTLPKPTVKPPALAVGIEGG